MSKSDPRPEELEAMFRELGAADPAAWASSEIDEGIPQLAIYLFLKLARLPIDELQDVSALRHMLNHAKGRKSLDALKRVLDSAAAPSDVLEVVRDALRSYLTELCFLLDDTAAIRFSGWPNAAALEKIHWGLFRMDDQGRPDAPMSGLHEVGGEVIHSEG